MIICLAQERSWYSSIPVIIFEVKGTWFSVVFFGAINMVLAI